MTGIRPGGQRGTALLGAAVTVLAIAVVLLVALHLGAWLRARAVAAGTADHAALAAAGALARPGRDPTVAARRVATAGGARLAGCDCSGLPVRVEVAVTIPELALLVDVVGDEVTATAHADLVAPP